MKRLFATLSLAVALFALALPAAAENGGATVVPSAVWAGGELFGTVLTPTTFSDRGPFDALYNFDGSGLMGQRSISVAGPGDDGYNGGRWEVFTATFTDLGRSVHDPDGDGQVNFELTSYNQLLQHVALGHITLGTEPIARFECPLRPNN